MVAGASGASTYIIARRSSIILPYYYYYKGFRHRNHRQLQGSFMSTQKALSILFRGTVWILLQNWLGGPQMSDLCIFKI